jgi:hypothetical protein
MNQGFISTFNYTPPYLSQALKISIALEGKVNRFGSFDEMD